MSINLLANFAYNLALKLNYHMIATKGNEVSFLPNVLVYPAADELSLCSISNKSVYYPGDLANILFWIRELKVENGTIHIQEHRIMLILRKLRGTSVAGRRFAVFCRRGREW
jgi:hypothetical protein